MNPAHTPPHAPPGAEVRRHESWANAADKARALDAGAGLDTRFPQVRAIADAMRAAHPDPYQRAHAIHQLVRDGISYRRDSNGEGREEFADSGAILRSGADDCDGKARLFVAICRAAAIPARIVPCIDAQHGFFHVQAEARPDGHGWTLAELILRGVAFGADPDSAPRDALGRRHFAGPAGGTVETAAPARAAHR